MFFYSLMKIQIFFSPPKMPTALKQLTFAHLDVDVTDALDKCFSSRNNKKRNSLESFLQAVAAI